VFRVDSNKFLGFMLTHKDLEANPEKCQAIIEMKSLNNMKEVQRLIGRLTIISRFLPRLANKTKPMMKLLKKSTKFVWDNTCQERFKELKKLLALALVLCKPNTQLSLLVYITTIEDTINMTLVLDVKMNTNWYTSLVKPLSLKSTTPYRRS